LAEPAAVGSLRYFCSLNESGRQAQLGLQVRSQAQLGNEELMIFSQSWSFACNGVPKRELGNQKQISRKPGGTGILPVADAGYNLR